MQPPILPAEDIAGIYRFAVLLAGAPAAAQSAILDVFADAGEKIHHFRTGRNCTAWLVAKVRNRLLNKTLAAAASANVEDPAPDENPPAAVLALAARFSQLPEPGRSALALLYIGHFSLQEIAQILQLAPEDLPAAIDSARVLLRQPSATAPGEESEAPGGSMEGTPP